MISWHFRGINVRRRIGVLYGKKALLEAMPPSLGGDMIKRASASFEPNELPYKFEAGTPATPGGRSGRQLIIFLSCMDAIAHEHEIIEYASSDWRKYQA
jgi:cysteine desulfurase/selenocysteine lyase